MSCTSLVRNRRRVGIAMTLLLFLGIAWYFSPGLPVLWGPYASAETKQAGKELFEHEWQPNDPLAGGDGLGPVFNARSCVACHFQGGVGGGGDMRHNVSTFEVVPTTQDPKLHAGVVHAAAVTPAYRESVDVVHKVYPVVRGGTRIVENCAVQIADFDPVRVESINSTALFGAGWIDRISSKAITQNHKRRGWSNANKELQLDFNTIGAGRPRILPDGRIGKFGWKAQFATLKEFVAAACANELGLGNPLMEQTKPLAKLDYPSGKTDLNKKQFAALVAFVDTLPRPVEAQPDRSAVRGKELFNGIGCAACHTPDLNGVKGVYSDFLLHVVEPPGTNGNNYAISQTPEVAPPSEHPKPEEWKTPPLWGVADSAPYFHDGASPTLKDAILRHQGAASSVTKAYKALTADEQKAVLAFLKTLKAPADAAPAKMASVKR